METHIVENLAKLAADGVFKGELIDVESEFSAISAVTGASAAGSRAYTASSSQGIALMHEVLFATAGMRLPIVMNVVNRALSAPINIWNDQQDSVSQRDNGWIQLYAETVQEAVDLTIQAFKIAEDRRVLLPVMACLDGFFLSHTMEPVDVPSSVKGFLGKYKPMMALDPNKPVTMGPLAFPEPYMEIRQELSRAMEGSAKVIKEASAAFAKKFGRRHGNGLIDVYGKGETAIVTMGSLAGNVREVVDADKGTSLVRIISFRPFPRAGLVKALSGKKAVIVMEKDVSLGSGGGALFHEVRSALYGQEKRPKVVGVAAGIGGTDVTVDMIRGIVRDSSRMRDGETSWAGR